MSTMENFDLTPQIEEHKNSFNIVHIYNKTNVYHLTKQVLLESMVPHNMYCLFYHMLTKTELEFNNMYGSYAYFIVRNYHEADLYLNVDSDSLNHIINYIQTSNIDGKKIYFENWRKVDEIIDLATMLGMSSLVSKLRKLHPSDQYIENTLKNLKQTIITSFTGFNILFKTDIKYENYNDIIEDLFNNNKQLLIDNYIKPGMYKNNPFNSSLVDAFVKILSRYYINEFYINSLKK
ncbi:hypothetical protein QLL95_gp0855 [Cotonvirus japonicus]|uniref:Uncharacterized protein n=1 Tax=Cotonvirus japonicus TaxID=2811091 RepID=A0ABM7NSW7_9VIRU|nr:hypothetical protein QLL95_gp0855 [Cotonvirus japonicus]BCS83268.1 hypothetical protein [Cotonvirus japonicus]